MKNPVSYPNIEKSAFRAGEYVGYAVGDIWRIAKHRSGWMANAQGSNRQIHGATLREISAELQAYDDKGKRMKNPIARKGVNKKSYVARPSQITRRKPSVRLLKRRTANVRRPAKGYFPNPGKTDVTAAHELVLWGVNDAELYRRRAIPIISNLAKKMKAGTYDAATASKAWLYWADNAAKKYMVEVVGVGFGPYRHDTGFGIFNKAARELAANEASDYYLDETKQIAGQIAVVKPRAKNPLVRPLAYRSRTAWQGRPLYAVEAAESGAKKQWITFGFFPREIDARRVARAYHNAHPDEFVRITLRD